MWKAGGSSRRDRLRWFEHVQCRPIEAQVKRSDRFLVSDARGWGRTKRR